MASNAMDESRKIIEDLIPSIVIEEQLASGNVTKEEVRSLTELCQISSDTSRRARVTCAIFKLNVHTTKDWKCICSSHMEKFR